MPLRKLQLIALEALEIAGGLVQTLRARHGRRGRAALADLEILVAEIVEELGAELRTVGVDVVDAHVVERVVDGHPLGSSPEAHGLVPRMGLVDDPFELLALGGDDGALAVPLGEPFEIGAYQGYALQLPGRVLRVPGPVETDVSRVIAEIRRLGNPPRHGDAHGVGIHRGIEHLGPAPQHLGDGAQRRTGLGLEFDHQLQMPVRIPPGASAVPFEKRHDRLHV